MKILKNVLAGVGVLVVLIATVLIIFFCGFAVGMDFEENAEKWINKFLYGDKKNRVNESDEIVFSSRKDAEDVLEKMKEILEEYGVVSIADMKDLSGITIGSYDEVKYGWFVLDHIGVHLTKEGYVIDLPEPSYLKERRKPKYTSYVHYNNSERRYG